MADELIKSRRNPLAQRARAVREGREAGSVFVEGVRLCREALSARVEFELGLYTQALADDGRGASLLEKLWDVCGSVRLVSEDVLASASDTKTPQGVVAVARRPETGRDVIERAGGTPLVVVMHRANNPSNAGAMLRVAEAAGAAGVVSTAGTTDLLAPKSLRSAMGSAFRLPIWAGARFDEVIGWCRARGLSTVSTDLGATVAHTEVDWTGAKAVLCGSESSGLSARESESANVRVRIPMRAPVESLNVAAALAVVLYEAARQRGFPR